MSLGQKISRAAARLSAGTRFLLALTLVAGVALAIILPRLHPRVAMEPAITQHLEPNELAQITTYLSGKSIPFKTEGDKLLVPADKKLEVLADLLYEDLLPGNTDDGFDAMFKQMSFWDSGSKLDHMYIRGKELTLRNIISRFPGVKKATVLIDPTSEQHIGGSVTPSALVDIQTRGNVKNVKRLATAAANAVLGAQSNLSRDKVQINIDGIPRRITDGDESPEPSEILAQREQQEQAYVAKLRKQLAFIPDALISVSFEPTEPVEAAATTQAAVASAREQRQLTLCASVAVPRSYFVRIYRSATPGAADPTDGILQPIIDNELPRIRKLVKNCLAIRSEDDVTVESYYDAVPPTLPLTRSASMPLLDLLRGHTREASIAGSVVLGLIITSLLLRRSPGSSSTIGQPLATTLLLADQVTQDDDDDPAPQNDQGDAHRYAQLIQNWVAQER
jgi:hypothetical protein